MGAGGASGKKRGKKGSKKGTDGRGAGASAGGQGAGASAGGANGTSGGEGSGDAPGDADRAVEAPPDHGRRWKSALLNDRKFSMATFRSEIDSSAISAADMEYNSVKLIRWPAFAPFGSRTDLPNILSSDASVARKYMAMCVLHADMRIPEDMCMKFEDRIRGRLGSGGCKDKVEEFNRVMKDLLKLRHEIKTNPDGGKVYPATFDGRDTQYLREDWLKLAGGDLEVCVRTRVWPSYYFHALHGALVQAGESVDVINDLPAYATIALHYAKAMREGRKMPAQLRPDPEPAYLIFEEESRLFSTKWRAMGWSFKAYGYHLWANLPTLFRKWGSLEGMSQQCVEGAIGKLGRFLRHMQLKPTGAYPKGIRGCREKELEELVRRRAALDAPAQLIAEEFLLDGLETRYGLHPGDKDAAPHRDILLNIDAAIKGGNVMHADVFTGYCRRYMLVERVRAHAVACSQMVRAHRQGNASFVKLHDEVVDYYSPKRFEHTVSNAHTNKEFDALLQGVRKAAWKASAKAVRTSGRGELVGGRTLQYQNMPRFAQRGPAARPTARPEGWGGA